MPIRAVCPSCSLALRIEPRHAAGPVRCPGCKAPFTLPVTLALSAATSPGKVRPRNEDAHLTHHLRWSAGGQAQELALLVVADGMGGHADGDKASSLAIATIARSLLPRLAEVVAGAETPDAAALAEWLDHGLWEANRAVLHAADGSGMGATAVAALAFGASVAVCHVGDCRAYLLREGKLRRLTEDQTLVGRMRELGQLGDAEAEVHPAGHEVTQALGRHLDLEASRQTLALLPGDALLLCCDGVHGPLSDDAIRDALAGDDPAGRLVRLSDEAGGPDNATAAVLRRA